MKGGSSLVVELEEENNNINSIIIIQNKDNKHYHGEQESFKIAFYSIINFIYFFPVFFAITYPFPATPRPHSLERSRGTSIQYRRVTQSVPQARGNDHPASPRPARRRGSGKRAAEARSRADSTVVTHFASSVSMRRRFRCGDTLAIYCMYVLYVQHGTVLCGLGFIQGTCVDESLDSAGGSVKLYGKAIGSIPRRNKRLVRRGNYRSLLPCYNTVYSLVVVVYAVR
jgi:hypothetical protein